MKTSDFDFELPDERIAKSPLPERDASRLLCLDLRGSPPVHRSFRELPTLLRRGDLLVVNDARVIRARLRGTKASGGQLELLVCDPLPPVGVRAAFRCLGQASRRLRVGQRVTLGPGGELRAEILAVLDGGRYDVAFDESPEEILAAVERAGELPLPPYLQRAPVAADESRYQTIFAAAPGAVAAPTAGLHFTEATFAALAAAGISRATVTLHVGPGTFLPVRVEELAEHRMHAERYEVPAETAAAIAATRAAGGRVVAVGTTSLRTLEAAARGGGAVHAGAGSTELFITPGHRFRVVDGLLTNFHLPRSTLLMLVAALAGRERLLAAYAEAVTSGYRFYSYGDAMLLL